METRSDILCSSCRVHTIHEIIWMGNGRLKYKCRECWRSSPVYEADGKTIVKHEQIIKEQEDWV